MAMISGYADRFKFSFYMAVSLIFQLQGVVVYTIVNPGVSLVDMPVLSLFFLSVIIIWTVSWISYGPVLSYLGGRQEKEVGEAFAATRRAVYLSVLTILFFELIIATSEIWLARAAFSQKLSWLLSHLFMIVFIPVFAFISGQVFMYRVRETLFDMGYRQSGKRYTPMSFRFAAIFLVVSFLPSLANFVNMTFFLKELLEDGDSFRRVFPGFLAEYYSTLFSIAIVGGFSFYLLNKSVMIPGKRLMEVTGEIRAGNLDTMVPVVSYDELGTMSESFNSMILELKQKKILTQYFSKDVMEKIISGDLENSMEGDSLEATVLFLDIRNFTGLSEKLEPSQVASLLNALFKDFMDLVFSHGGSVNKLIGDAMLATFGCPIASDDDARHALECALDLKETIVLFNQVKPDFLTDDIQIGIGVATGKVFAGNIGSYRRKEYTVIGDVVNTASRLQTLTKKTRYTILVDGATLESAGKDFQARRLSVNSLRGKTDQVTIYGIPGLF